MQARSIKRAVMCAPVHGALDQPRLFEHLDVLGDAVKGELEVARDLQDRGTLARKLRQNGSTNRVRKGVKSRIQALVCGSAHGVGSRSRLAVVRRFVGSRVYRHAADLTRRTGRDGV